MHVTQSSATARLGSVDVCFLPEHQRALWTPVLFVTVNLESDFERPHQSPSDGPQSVMTPQVRTPQVRTPQVRTPQVRTLQVRTPQVRTPQDPVQASGAEMKDRQEVSRKLQTPTGSGRVVVVLSVAAGLHQGAPELCRPVSGSLQSNS
ncbi:hypothetical protein EYF80_060301 [Liparis tanakae]|uniref:Uncharacterized protein n=1 Tax=Liparis tanakae TaxID=230148 RepID=A0A4Z2EL67_9TELE|nr:hypothetical protein EYF80_060301 [Liparis tanakae]